MKVKRVIAVVVFLAGVAGCSDNQFARPRQPGGQQADESATKPATIKQSTLPTSIAGSIARLDSPTQSSAESDGQPMYAMNHQPEADPPKDVLVWKHDWSFDQSDEDTLFGASLNAIGDVNGDGFNDFAAGGWKKDIDIYIFHGESGDLTGGEDLRIPTPQEGSHFGFTMASAGDVNDDGYDDVIIGAPSYSPSRDGGSAGGDAPIGSSSGPADAGVVESDSGPTADPTDTSGGPVSDDAGGQGDTGGGGEQPTEGAAYLYLGGSSGLSSTPAAKWVGQNPASQLGYTVDSAGDINRDGFSDIIIGAPTAPSDDGAPATGTVYLYTGSDAGIDPSATPIVLKAPAAGTAFGYSVAGVGDTNQDNFDDVLIGAVNASDGEQFEGEVYLYQGGQSGVNSTPDWTAAGANVRGAYFGWRVDGAGDINDDGFNDIVVGAPGYTSDPSDDEQALEGAVFAYMGSAEGMQASPAWHVESDRKEGLLGADISAGHDVNGDGYDDVLVADAHVGLVSYGGELYLGSAEGLHEDFDWQARRGGQSTIGDTARFIGDINSDGYADMLLGGPYFAAIYLYYGAPCFDADWDHYRGFNATTCPDGNDCIDLEKAAYPGADRRCDGIDTNCDGQVDKGCDDDEDGYCDSDIPGWAAGGNPSTCPNGLGDCDDEDPDHNPGSPELCNFRDDDCNDQVDEEPKVCGADQICVQGGCYSECMADADCAGGEKCFDGRCATDRCAGVECPDSQNECVKGTCQRTCSLQAECRFDGKKCIDGRCAVNPCDGILCSSAQVCQDGTCVDKNQGGPDAGADAGTDSGEDATTSSETGGANSGGDSGCSTPPGGGPPSGLIMAAIALGGLLWRRRVHTDA